MLYLVKSGDFVKVGYSRNINNRMNAYKTHHPDITLVKTKEGSKEDEKFIHGKYKDYLVNNSEWMKLPKDKYDELLNFFNTEISEQNCNCIHSYDIELLYNLTGKQCVLFFYCLKISSEGYEKCGYNSFLYDDLFIKIASEKLCITKEFIEECMLIFKDMKLIYQNHGGYMINPNVIYKGNEKFKNKLIDGGGVIYIK